MKEILEKERIKIKEEGRDDWLGFRGTSFGRIQWSQEPRPKFQQIVSLRKDKTNVFFTSKKIKGSMDEKVKKNGA
jgi:hypothetical protein